MLISDNAGRSISATSDICEELWTWARRRVSSSPLNPLTASRAPDVTFGEKAVLEVALRVGWNVLARDLERKLGTPLDEGATARAIPA
jgi:hypothetical protein